MIMLTAIALLVALSQTIAQKAPRDTASLVKAAEKVNGAIARFDKTTYEFADLNQGSPGTASFTLVNDGNEPLIISSAKASCGCTNLSYSKDPVLPGKSVTISVTYNAAAIGDFIKTVTVTTNASDKPVVLQIRGKVLAKS